MAAYCPSEGELVPGFPLEEARKVTLPTLVLRSGTTDLSHRRETSEQVAAALPNARLVEPPWGDNEWNERSAARPAGRGEGLFAGWPQLAPMLIDWAPGDSRRTRTNGGIGHTATSGPEFLTG
jgi:hypothetical protein